MITAAQKDGKLSAPVFSISSENDAIEALPEKGLVIRRVKSSEGIPRCAFKGSRRSPTASRIPEAESIFTPTIMATSDGISPNETSSPSFAPFLKESKPTFLLKSRKTAAIPITSGTENAAIFSIISMTFVYLPFHRHGKVKVRERHS